MGIPLGFEHFILPLSILVTAFVSAGMATVVFRRRDERRHKNRDLVRFSSLHFFSKELADCVDPQEMSGRALRGALEMLEVAEGYLLLTPHGPNGTPYTSSSGLSPTTLQGLDNDRLRSYLATSGERWGTLMVFPDLLRPEVLAAWQRDPLFQAFRDVMKQERLRTVVVSGLLAHQKSYGALLLGSRKARSFPPQSLRMMLALGNQIGVAVENWSLNRAADRHNEELRILQKVGEALRETFDMKLQVEILRRELHGLLGRTDFSLALQESPEGPLVTVVAFDSPHSSESQEGVPAGKLAEYVMRTDKPLLLGENVPAGVRNLGVEAVNPETRTWCGVPIRFSDGSTGVLSLADFEHEHAISERQFELIRVVATEAAGAFENARLFRKEQRRSRHLALLNELGRKAMSVLNPRELLPSICCQVQSAFGYDLARIELMDRETGELIVEAVAGYREGLRGRRVRVGEGLSGAAVETGEAVLANDVAREPRWVEMYPGVRSALSLPLKYRETILGALSLESYCQYAFSQQDVLTLQTLADQLAIAVHNAQAYQVALDEAITDALTGLKSHRFFMEALEREWRRSTRTGRKFSLIMLDLDRFKNVNDRHGHMQGDRVLTAVAGLVGSQVRQSNVLARYGGNKFAILMPEAIAEQAKVLAERLRASLERDQFLKSYDVTASFGIATFPDHGATQEDILRVADSGIYLAKHRNGNQVRLASLALESGQSEWEQQLLEAYLGVTVKRLFSTGPETFNHYLRSFQRQPWKADGEGPSLLETVTALAFAIDAKDHYTQGHSQSVARLAAEIARELGLGNAEVEEVRVAGILHDIGKIGVPEIILNKPAHLTMEEFDLMKSHAVLGEKILEPLKVKAIERIRRMIRHHHEMFDGSGYPDHLKGEAIPLGARILTVADCFDTMVSQRAYKRGRTSEEAVAELRRCCGTQFDPVPVGALIRVLAVGEESRRRAVSLLQEAAEC
jgi:diguanylate cyclase (GGDEF)-like protein/putative nucleotidyltransferase with HDIG domain